MPGFFQKLAARTLGSGAQLVKPIVPSVFSGGGLIEPALPAAVEQMPERTPRHTAAQSSENIASAPQAGPRLEPSPAQPDWPKQIERRPFSLHEAVDAIFASPEIQPVLVPLAPASFESGPPSPNRAAVREAVQQSIGHTAQQGRRVSDASTEKAPAIRVTIGRVEVKAEFPAPTAPVAPRPNLPPALSLDEYRRQRDRGLR